MEIFCETRLGETRNAYRIVAEKQKKNKKGTMQT
jgi:hypothetical protein